MDGRDQVGSHELYSGNYSGVFIAPKNAQNEETKCQSGAVPILLLALLALMTGAYSSLDVSQGLNPNVSYLKRQSTTRPHQLGSCGDIFTCSRFLTGLR